MGHKELNWFLPDLDTSYKSLVGPKSKTKWQVFIVHAKLKS